MCPQQFSGKNTQLPNFNWEVDCVIERALTEDIRHGDITSHRVIPDDLFFEGVMSCRQEIIVAGLDFARRVFRTLDPDIAFMPGADDGDCLEAGATVARLLGRARSLLTAERTALNLLQHLSGIATMTRSYVNAIAGTGAILLDTRKTIPGLRLLAKYATRIGGAQNHRMGLYDGILIKDNHIAVCGSVSEAVYRAKIGEPSNIPVEVECDNLDQVREAVMAGADIIMFDNMSPEMMREAVAIVGNRAKTEASGGVDLAKIRAIAETGVNFISVGRLTQSAPAVDIGLDWSVFHEEK